MFFTGSFGMPPWREKHAKKEREGESRKEEGVKDSERHIKTYNSNYCLIIIIIR